MSAEDLRALLEDCANKLNINTSHTENFLELQDDVAADFTSLTKVLYDFHKRQEPGRCKGSPLDQLVVEDFDEEQIWQELELQNTPVLRHFETVVSGIISDDALTILEEEEDHDDIDEEMEEDIAGEDEEEEEPRQKNKKQREEEEDGEGDFTDEDSDIDFDVDALEKREKQRRKQSKASVALGQGEPSEVDSRFFKCSEMDPMMDHLDKLEEDETRELVDHFYPADRPSDDDDVDTDEEISFKKQKKHKAAKSPRNLMYKDYWMPDAGDSGADKAEQQSEDEDDSMDDMQDDPEEEEEEEDGDHEDTFKEKGTRRKRVTFNLSGGEEESEGDEESEGEDIEDIFGKKAPKDSEKAAYKSSFEKRQEKMNEKIQELEKSALSEKPWQLSGEVSAQTRPENSMLEEDVQFDQASRLAPAVTEETTLQLEDIIKQRIKDQVFDDVVRKTKPKEDAFEYKKRLTLDHEKSKLSLAQVYEQEYLKKTQEKTEEVENPAHVEIQKLMDTLFLKLDALSNFHFTPKPPVPEVKVVSNLPSIAMEEVAPVSASDATLLAPEEVKEKSKAGDVLGDSEKTSTDKKRERRKKKTVKRLKIKEKERRQKEREASRVGGENKKPTKAEAAQNLQKITKGGKAKILKDEGKDKAVRSSQAFFSQLQDQVKSQIKSVKDQATKKKKHKEVSVGKLKL